MFPLGPLFRPERHFVYLRFGRSRGITAQKNLRHAKSVRSPKHRADIVARPDVRQNQIKFTIVFHTKRNQLILLKSSSDFQALAKGRNASACGYSWNKHPS